MGGDEVTIDFTVEQIKALARWLHQQEWKADPEAIRAMQKIMHAAGL